MTVRESKGTKTDKQLFVLQYSCGYYRWSGIPYQSKLLPGNVYMKNIYWSRSKPNEFEWINARNYIVWVGNKKEINEIELDATRNEIGKLIRYLGNGLKIDDILTLMRLNNEL